MHNKLSRALRLFVAISMVLPSLAVLFNVSSMAAKLADGVATITGNQAVITFTSTSNIVAGDKIVLTFNSGTTTVNAAGTNVSLTGSTTPARANNAGNNSITITADGAASGAISITMTDALTSYTNTTYAIESVAINHNASNDSAKDFGVALITNDNTTLVTAIVPLFLNVSVDTTTINLGTLSTGSVNSGAQIYTVNSNNQTGVDIDIDADGPFDTAGGATIDDVADTAVTAGSEEYGFETATSGLTLTAPYNAANDQPVPQALDDIASSAAPVNAATLTLTFKASISGLTQAGVYDQIVTLTASTNL